MTGVNPVTATPLTMKPRGRHRAGARQRTGPPHHPARPWPRPCSTVRRLPHPPPTRQVRRRRMPRSPSRAFWRPSRMRAPPWRPAPGRPSTTSSSRATARAPSRRVPRHASPAPRPWPNANSRGCVRTTPQQHLALARIGTRCRRRCAAAGARRRAAGRRADARHAARPEPTRLSCNGTGADMIDGLALDFTGARLAARLAMATPTTASGRGCMPRAACAPCSMPRAPRRSAAT
ncbi:MAG: hypothetical protein M0C28_11590 [Candidatus Moduliflexus flocculans]|nr:hypothetical protein [Candidatus Moduliflexus flocculans]